MLFVEQLSPEDLSILRKGERSDHRTKEKIDTSTLCQEKRDPTAAICSRFERLVDHVFEIEQEKRGRNVPRSVIRSRIFRALMLGTITMDMTPQNTITKTSFSPRKLTPDQKAFGVFESDMPNPARHAASRHLPKQKA